MRCLSFQADDDKIFERDFLAPTGQDKEVDREFLPKVLQVKKWGLKGRTKYTHLTDQDTTRKDANPWVKGVDISKQIGMAGRGIPMKIRPLAGEGAIGAPKKKQKTGHDGH